MAIRFPSHRGPEEPGLLEATALAAEHADLLLLGAARDLHRSVAARVGGGLRLAGVADPLALRAHDQISAGLYAGIGLGLRAAARGLRAADARGIGPAVDATAAGRFTLSAVNGLIGDQLHAGQSRLAIEIGLRQGGREVAVTAPGLAAAYPEASDALVVFVHGLCENEGYWQRRSRPRRPEGATAPDYGARLAADEGWSPLWVRLNTGLTVAESGVALSALLARVVEVWPVPVRRIALVGHSMGGLIARAACAVQRETGQRWTERLTDLVTLGAPHTGSGVERAIARGVHVGRRVPELAPLARIFEQRSVGVLDLHQGMPLDAAAVPGLRYGLVAATLSRSPRHLLAATVGDGLVQYRSAAGLLPDGSQILPGAEVVHVPGAGHFDLLNHDDVYAAMRGWLAHRSRAAGTWKETG